MKIRGNHRRIDDSAMDPCTTGCGLCPSRNVRINPIVNTVWTVAVQPGRIAGGSQGPVVNKNLAVRARGPAVGQRGLPRCAVTSSQMRTQSHRTTAGIG
jgi:hypothetical protein